MKANLTFLRYLALWCAALLFGAVSVSAQDDCDVRTGIVPTSNGERIIDVTVGDGEADVIQLVPDFEIAAGTMSAIVLADENYNLISAEANTDQIDLEGVEGGKYNIFYINYTGNFGGLLVPGESVYPQKWSDECYLISDNEIIVNATAVEPACKVTTGIFTVDGQRIIDVTSGTGSPVIVTATPDFDVFVNTAVILADSNYNLVSINPNSTEIDLDGLPTGEYNIFFLTYTGDIRDDLAVGETVYTQKWSTECWLISDNEIITNVTNVTPVDPGVDSSECRVTTGIFTTTDGDRIIDVITGTGSPVNVTLVAEYDIFEKTAVILADENYNLISIVPNSLTIDIDSAESGLYNIFLLTYTGEIRDDLKFGETVYTQLWSTECWLISENEIITTVTNQGEPCKPTTGIFTVDGERIIYPTTGTGSPVIITLTPDYEIFEKTAVIVADSNYTLVSIEPNTLSIDIDSLATAKYNIFLLTYTGEIRDDLKFGETVYTQLWSTECWLISENEIITFVTNGGDGGEEPDDKCDAVAGTLTASFEALDGTGFAITAVAADAATVPEGYTQLYVLTSGDDLVVEDFGASAEFTVEEPGDYRVHSLVAVLTDSTVAGVPLSALVPGETTAADVIAAAGDACYALSGGSLVTVVDEPTCDAAAGTLTASFEAVDGVGIVITAVAADAATVPEGYTQLYVLTSGDDLVVEDFGASAEFTVEEPGDYRVHSLVAVLTDSTVAGVPLSALVPGETTAADVIAAAGDACYALSAGSLVTITDDAGAECEAEAGTLTTANADVALGAGGSVVLTATQDMEAVIPEGFVQAYVLTSESGSDLIVEGASLNAQFTVTEAGIYRIHSAVVDQSDAAFVDLLSGDLVPGETTVAELLAAIDAIDAEVCFSLSDGVAITVSATDGFNAVTGINMGIYQADDDKTLRVRLVPENPISGEVEVFITNMTGRVIASTKLNDLPAEQTVSMSIPSAQAGSYFVSARTSKGVQTEAAVVK